MPRKYTRRFRPRKGMRTIYRNPVRGIPHPLLKNRYRPVSQKTWQRLSFGSPRGWMTSRSPFPPNLFTTFTYTETIAVTQVTAGVPQAYVFRANGPFDPNQTSTGGQPRYYDSLLGAEGGTAPYRNYRVHASKIKVDIYPQDSTASAGNVLVSVIPGRSTIGTPSSVDEQRERPYGKSVAMTTLGSWKPYRLSNFTKMKTHLGVKDLTDDPSSAALYNANPSSEVYWNIIVTAINSSATATLHMQVTITYFVQLYSLTDVADS